MELFLKCLERTQCPWYDLLLDRLRSRCPLMTTPQPETALVEGDGNAAPSIHCIHYDREGQCDQVAASGLRSARDHPCTSSWTVTCTKLVNRVSEGMADDICFEHVLQQVINFRVPEATSDIVPTSSKTRCTTRSIHFITPMLETDVRKSRWCSSRG